MERIPIYLLISFLVGCCCIATVKILKSNKVPNVTSQKERKLLTVKVTAYCPNKCCNGRWFGVFADGTKIPSSGFYCASDWRVLPYKSKILFNGNIYEVRDVGGKIKGYHIDILKQTHKEALKFGVKYNQEIEVIQ